MTITESATHLRRVLTVNAALSGLTAIAGLAFAPRIADVLDAGNPTVVRIVSAALALWAIDVALLSRAGLGTVRRFLPVVIAGDLAWVAGVVALAAAGVLAPAGAALMGATAGAVGALAAAQIVLGRRLTTTVGRDAAPAAQVRWG